MKITLLLGVTTYHLVQLFLLPSVPADD